MNSISRYIRALSTLPWINHPSADVLYSMHKRVYLATSQAIRLTKSKTFQAMLLKQVEKHNTLSSLPNGLLLFRQGLVHFFRLSNVMLDKCQVSLDQTHGKLAIAHQKRKQANHKHLSDHCDLFKIYL